MLQTEGRERTSEAKLMDTSSTTHWVSLAKRMWVTSLACFCCFYEAGRNLPNKLGAITWNTFTQPIQVFIINIFIIIFPPLYIRETSSFSHPASCPHRLWSQFMFSQCPPGVYLFITVTIICSCQCLQRCPHDASCNVLLYWYQTVPKSGVVAAVLHLEMSCELNELPSSYFALHAGALTSNTVHR